MNEETYVIVIDGEPYLDKDWVAIRKYKTLKGAEKSAQVLTKRGYANRRVQIGKFAAVDLIDVTPQ
jgi:hypothetical protein